MPKKYAIATANTAKALKWRAQELTWEEIVSKLSAPRRTEETCADYDRMSKPERAKVKDGPAFVAGILAKGRRRKGSVLARSCVVLDADRSDAELFDDWRMLIGSAAVLYPTHSSRPGALKHRLVIPLSRDVTPDEYVPLALRLIETLGADRFDPTTVQPERLMYFPSASADAPFEVKACEGKPLNPDAWLATYEDWHDVTEWPLCTEGVKRRVEKAPDPRNKRGAIGAFCRAFSIESAIEEFLSDEYEPTRHKGRYTYIKGSSVAGVACYSDLWAYSNHATDPAGGQLCNAFDLVRIHRFGELDDGVEEEASITSLPSYKAMCEWASNIDIVALELARGAARGAAEDFGEATDEVVDESWKAKLSVNAKTGIADPSAANILLVLRRDQSLAGKFWRDVESGAVWVRGKSLPWRKIARGADVWSDEDDAALRLYFETRYGIKAKGTIDDALSFEATQRPYDPLRERLETLAPWDGIPRLDSLLIDTLGAEDCEYTRQVTRKTLAGAVMRALQPGCKWDYMLILEGAQGLGKSSLWRMLAGDDFFTDCLTVRDTELPKVAGEKIRGMWIVEVAELDGMAKASIERLKSLLSTQEDNYRAAYAKHARTYKRRCIIAGTVNNLDGYLRDATGNRRFWPVRVTSKLDRSLMTPDYIEQVWAEAKVAFEAGEKPYLEGEALKDAESRQREAMETDPREGQIREYLDTPVPNDFVNMDLEAREAFWDLSQTPEKDWEAREQASIIEIWHECLKQPKERPTRRDSREIATVLSRIGWEPTGKAARTKAYGVQKMYQKRGVTKHEKP